MSNKSNILLLIIFILTVAAVGGLGYVLISQQQQQLRMGELNRARIFVDMTSKNINDFVNAFESRLHQVINMTETEMEQEIRNNPVLHSISVYDAAVQLLFPHNQSMEKQRAVHQWMSNISVQAESSAQNETSGWFSWHNQQKENFIFWMKRNGKNIFIELNNAMFMAEFIHYLSQQPDTGSQSYLMINDNSGRIFYQWGDSALAGSSDLSLQNNLSAPLNGWSLQYYSLLPELSVWSKYLFQIIIAAVVILLCVLSYVLFQIKRREQKEARQRLSFINQVSHELKTPLTNIRLHSELLERTIKKDQDDTLSGQSINIIQQESERLTRMINNVLNFSSIEKKTLKLNRADIDANDLLKQCVEPFQLTFDRFNINIIVENEIDRQVSVDTDICKQIIGNLLSNIEKYANQSETVTIHAKEIQDMISITVCDQGQGIKSGLAEKIFQPFYRIRNDLTTASGSGLGLGLSRDLARMHGGELKLADTLSKGACFELTLRETENA